MNHVAELLVLFLRCLHEPNPDLFTSWSARVFQWWHARSTYNTVHHVAFGCVVYSTPSQQFHTVCAIGF